MVGSVAVSKVRCASPQPPLPPSLSPQGQLKLCPALLAGYLLAPHPTYACPQPQRIHLHHFKASDLILVLQLRSARLSLTSAITALCKPFTLPDFILYQALPAIEPPSRHQSCACPYICSIQCSSLGVLTYLKDHVYIQPALSARNLSDTLASQG